MGWLFHMSQSASCKVLAMAARNFFFMDCIPHEANKLALGGISTKDLAMIFNNIPFIHIVIRVNVSLDGSGDLRATRHVGIVLYMCVQPA